MTESYTTNAPGQRVAVQGVINETQYNVRTAKNQLMAPGDDVNNPLNSSNRLRYDEAGNQVFDNYTQGAQSRGFDAENRIQTIKACDTCAESARYMYDSDGKRVKRLTYNGTWTEVWQVYGIDGELLAEYAPNANPSSPQKEYGYRAGQLLVTADATTIKWAVADHLGTPRIILDKSGTLASVERHDYLPFGEELIAGIGIRNTTTTGYIGNSLRQKFGSKERDNETGLDWFSPGRYFSSSQGRFTTVDPLMSSGTIYDPQTWNRYCYTINNPLKYTDPFGLFIWSDSLGGNATDEELRIRAGKDKNALKEANKIINKRQAFRDGLTEASRAANNQNLTADQRAQISGALASYGAEGTDNGVSVGLGRLANGVAAEARTAYFPFDTNSNTFAARVEVVLSDRGSGNLAIDIAHEGRHVADAQAFAGALTADLANQGLNAIAGALNRTRYDREVRGYLVSSYTAQGLGLPNLSFGSREVWNSGWREAERAELRSRAISNHLRESPTYRLTPEAPGERYIPRQ